MGGWLVIAVAVIGCQRVEPTPSSGSAAAGAASAYRKGKVELVEPEITIEPVSAIAAEVARAAVDHKHAIVYVGASWCEPCTRFHDAAVTGALDAQFGDTRFIVFDKDRDGDALERAGYRSTYIPLFALANTDGTASGKQIEGSIKGTGAVGNIAPRLRALLGE